MKALKVIKNIILYVLAISFVIFGISGIITKVFFAALAFWLCALFTFPFFHTLIDNLRSKKGLKKVKWWIYIILVILFFVIGIILWPTDTEDESTKEKSLTEEITQNENTPNENTEVDLSDIDADTTDESNTDIVDDGIVEKLMEFGFTEEEAYEMRELFIMCGVTNIDGCEPTDPDASIDGVASFRAEWDKDRVFWFTVDNREVFYMSLNGTDVYDKDQGGFLINVNDVHVPESSMTNSEKEELQDETETVLDKYFKHAPYYDAWGFARSDDDYMVQCEAYASNDLGVKKYVSVKVWYSKDENEYKVTGVSIDGVQYEVK